MADDDVQLTDLEVIQRYSLAVRGATAARDDLVRALQADLDWLKGGRRSKPEAARTGSAPVGRTPAKAATPAKVADKAPDKAAAKASGKASAPAKSAPAKRTPAKRSGKG